MNLFEKKPMPIDRVPENEIHIEFVRSSGPGGQKVNKTSSKAQLRWNVDDSSVFSDIEKERIKERLHNRLNAEGEIVLSSDQERSQFQNKTNVIARLQQLIRDALTIETERVETTPSKSSDEKRLKAKKIQGEKKQRRRDDWE